MGMTTMFVFVGNLFVLNIFNILLNIYGLISKTI